MLPQLALLFAVASSLPWIEDNYSNAVALAKSRQVPVFVELWAPW